MDHYRFIIWMKLSIWINNAWENSHIESIALNGMLIAKDVINAREAFFNCFCYYIYFAFQRGAMLNSYQRYSRVVLDLLGLNAVILNLGLM